MLKKGWLFTVRGSAPWAGVSICEDHCPFLNRRLDEDASPKKVNLEAGMLRAILERGGQWARLQSEVRMLPTRDDVGRAISPEEETALLQAGCQSCSRSLVPFVTLAPEAGARYGVLRTLQWGNVDFDNHSLKWGIDKTASGTGRIVPLSQTAFAALGLCATHFPRRNPEQYVFPSERYGAGVRTNSTPGRIRGSRPSPSVKVRKHWRLPDCGPRGF